MNMKKTMAAIAACAVAVSAMATTVSAVEDQTYPYDLTAAEKVWESGTCVISANFSGVTIAPTADVVAFGIVGLPAGADQITVTIKDTTGGAGNKVFTSSWAENWMYQIGEGYMVIPAEAIPATACDITIAATVKHNLQNEWPGAGDVIGAGTFAGATGVINTDQWSIADLSATTVVDKTATVISNVTGSKKTILQRPLETKLDGNKNIINYLKTAAVNGDDGNSYKNVTAVINDAIKNYETVTFQFNSAKEPVTFVAWVNDAIAVKADSKAAVKQTITDNIESKSEALGKAKAAEEAAQKAIDDAVAAGGAATPDQEEALAKAKAATADAQAELDAWKNATVDWFYKTGDWPAADYSEFTQHLYNGVTSENYFKAEGTDYLGLDWAGYNLFQGGLVINEGYTMSLADTTMFDWGKSSVSFDWDTIADAASSVYNPYALYLQSMELATSVDWYWDSMDLILTAGAVDDATSDAGAETDDEVLDETPVDDEAADEEAADEEITEDEFADEEAADDEVAADDEEAAADDEEAAADDEEAAADDEAEDEAADEEVSNPTTGNASVALAVIPVALAAAAVVAKKRS